MGTIVIRFPETALSRPKLGGDVYTLLRKAILTCDYGAGERLPLDSLARKFATNISVVRKAVQQLAAEGLVEVRPRSGSYVASLTASEIEEICDIRRGLECLAAETAVRRISTDEIRGFQDLVLSMAGPVDSGEKREAHERRNTELHRMLVRASGNGRLVETYENLKVHLQMARLGALGRMNWAARLTEEYAEHSEMLQCLQTRDAERLKAVLARHIERAKVQMLAALRGVAV